jgi:hypothetical protein
MVKSCTRNPVEKNWILRQYSNLRHWLTDLSWEFYNKIWVELVIVHQINMIFLLKVISWRKFEFCRDFKIFSSGNWFENHMTIVLVSSVKNLNSHHNSNNRHDTTAMHLFFQTNVNFKCYIVRSCTQKLL